ncbi:AT-rich interactive domain-containing protein 1A [Drosophila subobscura]|uniref:AT-rich interactive domain-containing protein 1A n=1 Tax=Drosophila subobscura TaxID=7241 RepID=UPI00155AEAC8|nr:AT-rich interactive domain-containing protein 1A [Drosophila subobscura]
MSACQGPLHQCLMCCQCCSGWYRGDPHKPCYCPQCCPKPTCPPRAQFPEEFAKFSDMTFPCFLCKQHDPQAKEDDKQKTGNENKKTGRPAAKKKGKQKPGDGNEQTGRAVNASKRTERQQEDDGNPQTGRAVQRENRSGRQSTQEGFGQNAKPGIGANRKSTQAHGDGNMQNGTNRKGREPVGDGNGQAGRAGNGRASSSPARKSGKNKTGDGNGPTSVPGNGANGTPAQPCTTQGGSYGQGVQPSSQGMPPGMYGTQNIPPDMYGMAPGTGAGYGAYGQQGAPPFTGAQAAMPEYTTQPLYGSLGPGGPAPNSTPFGYPPQPTQAPDVGPQGMASYGPQGVPAYDPQAMQGYETYGQGVPQAQYAYGDFGATGPLAAPYPQPEFPSGEEYAGHPPPPTGYPPPPAAGYPPPPAAGYPPPPAAGYPPPTVPPGAAAPAGYPPGQAAGLPSDREPQFNPCTGEDPCTCPCRRDADTPRQSQQNNGGECYPSNLSMDAIQRFLKSLQLSCPANGLQNCALLLPIDMASRTDEGESKKLKKSAPKRKLSKSEADKKAATSGGVAATKSKGSASTAEDKSKPPTPEPSNENAAKCAADCHFNCNTSCMNEADDSSQSGAAKAKINENPKESPPAARTEPATCPIRSGCNTCCNGCCQPCHWPSYYYCYNPYTGCYYWYPSYCHGCQNCRPIDPLEKTPEKPKPKEAAPAAASPAKASSGASVNKGKKINDRKVGGGQGQWNITDQRMSSNQSCSLRGSLPKRHTATSSRNIRQGIMPGYYPTSTPSDCSPYGQIGPVRSRIR